MFAVSMANATIALSDSHPQPGSRNIESRRLSGLVAVVTGASSGIGRAMAVALSLAGARLYIVGREHEKLMETKRASANFSSISEFQADITDENDLQRLVRRLQQEGAKVDILVHSAGTIHQDLMVDARIADMDAQYAINVRAPYRLTQCLLPFLTTARGQVVFVNSSAGIAAKRPEIGQYAATKHALKAIADSLRVEVNEYGVRVLSVYLGRTSTPLQAALHRAEEKEYHPEVLLQPEDVASLVVHALSLPPTAEVTDIIMRPGQKTY